jgi:hypothetical protein
VVLYPASRADCMTAETAFSITSAALIWQKKRMRNAPFEIFLATRLVRERAEIQYGAEQLAFTPVCVCSDLTHYRSGDNARFHGLQAMVIGNNYKTWHDRAKMDATELMNLLLGIAIVSKSLRLELDWREVAFCEILAQHAGSKSRTVQQTLWTSRRSEPARVGLNCFPTRPAFLIC